jgi:hypothetical protein
MAVSAALSFIVTSAGSLNANRRRWWCPAAPGCWAARGAPAVSCAALAAARSYPGGISTSGMPCAMPCGRVGVHKDSAGMHAMASKQHLGPRVRTAAQTRRPHNHSAEAATQQSHSPAQQTRCRAAPARVAVCWA